MPLQKYSRVRYITAHKFCIFTSGGGRLVTVANWVSLRRSEALELATGQIRQLTALLGEEIDAFTAQGISAVN